MNLEEILEAIKRIPQEMIPEWLAKQILALPTPVPLATREDTSHPRQIRDEVRVTSLTKLAVLVSHRALHGEIKRAKKKEETQTHTHSPQHAPQYSTRHTAHRHASYPYGTHTHTSSFQLRLRLDDSW